MCFPLTMCVCGCAFVYCPYVYVCVCYSAHLKYEIRENSAAGTQAGCRNSCSLARDAHDASVSIA